MLIALAIVIALLGIANTLSLSIHERRRELGLLRLVGQTGRQLRRMVRLEALLVAAFGTVTGIAFGFGSAGRWSRRSAQSRTRSPRSRHRSERSR